MARGGFSGGDSVPLAGGEMEIGEVRVGAVAAVQNAAAAEAGYLRAG